MITGPRQKLGRADAVGKAIADAVGATSGLGRAACPTTMNDLN
jgi:hypothetical protein